MAADGVGGTAVRASTVTPIKGVRADGRKSWDEGESERILAAAKACGWKTGLQRGDWSPDWTVMSAIVKTRTAKQCRERWENFADPVRDAASRVRSNCSWADTSRGRAQDIDQTPLSPREEQQLLQLVKAHGPKWAEIAKKLPQRAGRRPAQHLKNHWNRLVGEARRPHRGSSSAEPQKSSRGSCVEQVSGQQHRGAGQLPVQFCDSAAFR